MSTLSRKFVASCRENKIIMVPWRVIEMLNPRHIRRRIRSNLRSRQSPASSITELNTSWSPILTLKSLNSHRWTTWDAQYALLATIFILSISLIESPGPLACTSLAVALLVSLVFPVACQFFLPALPIIAWLVLFYAMKFIPEGWRPPIWVRMLPAIENMLFGANLSSILSVHKTTLLDLMAWLPYGICHFPAPALASGILFLFGPPGITPCFAKTFGYMNLVGVTVQFLFPCSPPWYENLYGLASAHYGIQGHPAGLARIDQLFGINLYTSGFGSSPIPFGAFPSLHAADSMLIALFLSWVFPRAKAIFFLYAGWLWWATMYLSHHYAIDVIAGAILAAGCFYCAETLSLPRLQPQKSFRWDYDHVELGRAPVDTQAGKPRPILRVKYIHSEDTTKY